MTLRNTYVAVVGLFLLLNWANSLNASNLTNSEIGQSSIFLRHELAIQNSRIIKEQSGLPALSAVAAPTDKTFEACGTIGIGSVSLFPYSTSSSTISVSDFRADGGTVSTDCTGGDADISISYIDVSDDGSDPEIITRTFTIADCDASQQLTQTFTINQPTPLNPGAHNIDVLTVCSVYNPVQLNLDTPASGGILPYSYQWQENGVDIPGATDVFYDPPNITTPGLYEFRVAVTDDCGTTIYTSPKSITVNSQPTATISGDNTICNGESSSITINLTGTQPWSITYTDGTTPVTQSGITTSPYTFNVSPSTNTNYTLTSVSDANCSGTFSGNATITVNPIPVVTPSPASETICSDATTNISLSSSVAGTTFDWTVAQTGVTGASNGSGNVIAQTLSTTGSSPGTATYTITSTANGCTGTPVDVVITVNPTPTVIPSPTSETICSENASSITLSSAVAGTTFNWTVSQSGVTGATNGSGNTISQTLSSTGTSPGTATYTITPSANGCSGTPEVVVITVNPIPTIDPITNQVVCNNDATTTINFSGTASYYNWSNDNTSIGLLGSGTGNILSFTATNPTGFVKTATITATPYYSNGGLDCPGSTESFAITVNPTPTVNDPADQSLCNGETTSVVTFSGTANRYDWVNNDTSIGLAASGTGNISTFTATNSTSSPVTATITVTPIYTNGGIDCPGTSENFTITVNPPPTADAIANQYYCNGETTSAIPITGSPPSVVFDISGGSSIGLADQTNVTEIPSFTTSSGTSTITITPKANGCSGTPQTFSITVQSSPTAGEIDDNQSICPNTLPATFNSVVDGTGDGTISYLWQSSIDDGASWTPISGANSKFYTSPSLTQTTKFRRITVSDSNGICYSAPTNEIEVVAYDNEAPEFTPPSDITVNTNGSCTADVTTASTGTVTIKTDNCTAPNDIIVNYSDDPIINGTCTGTYSFTRHWTLTDNEGNSDTKDQIITVADKTKPIVTAPSTISISCEDSTNPTNTGQATASDNCDSNPTITYTDITTAGSCTNNYTITRNWIATDCSGNISEINPQIINIIDNTDPVASIPNIYVDLSSESLPYPYADLTEFMNDGGNIIDNCSSTYQFELSDEYAYGLDDVAGYCPDSIWRYYRITDECGNFQDLIQSIIITDKGNCSPCIYNNSFFVVDFLNDPEGTMDLIERRRDKCCDTNLPGNVNCIAFNIRLDDDAVGLEILVQGGAPDFKDWKVDCESIDVNGGVVCMPGGDFHLFTFCKQGNNPSNYSFRSIPGVIASDDISTRVDCSGQIETDGITGNPTWTSVWPGIRGQYDSYLSSTTVAEPIFIADENSPPEIHYEICADIGTTICNALGTDCDTIAIYVKQKIDVAFNEDPTTICENNIPTLTADVSPAGATYIYEWYTGHDATGTPFLTGTDNYTPTSEGLFSLKVIDTENGIPCSEFIRNFEVIFDETGISNFTFPDGDLEIECNASNATQLIQDWLNSATAVDYDGSSVAVNNDFTGITQACGTVLPVTFSANDVCGNLGDSIAYIRVFDTTPPVINAQAIDSYSECEGTDPASNSSYLAWLASNGVANITDVCDNNLDWTNNSASQSWSGDAANNSITITFTATDDCGNAVQTVATYTVRDTEAPTITCSGDISETAGTNNCDKTLTTLTDPTIYDLCSTPTLSWTMSGATTGSGTGTVTGETFNVGTTTVTYIVTDAALLSNNCEFDVTILDVVPPVFDAGCPLVAVPPVNAETDACDAFVTVPVPVVSDPCNEGYTITNDFNGTADASGRYSVGTTTINWTITDASGNPTTCSQDITVIDNQDPGFITCPTDVSQTAGPNNCYLENVTITDPTFTDNCPNPVLTYELLHPDASTTSGTGSVSGLTFDVGTTTVTYTITDAANRTATCQFDVTVLDIVPPEFDAGCPLADVPSVNAETNLCDAFVTVPVPLVSDPCGEGYTITNDFNGTGNASDRYPVGTTTVNWTITDASGNPTSCSQDITVVDNQDPEFTSCPVDVEDEILDGGCTLVNASIPNPTFSDNCSIDRLVYTLSGATTGNSPASGINYASDATLNIGLTAIEYTVYDVNGRSAICSFNVWIKNLNAPQFSLTCPNSNISVNSDPDNCDAMVSVPAPTINNPCNETYTITNDSPYNTSNTDASGTYPSGSTSFNWTITDASGNVTNCPQTVIVTDIQDPIISCPGLIEDQIINGGCTLVNPTIPNPTFSDNCIIDRLVYILSGATTGNSPATGINYASNATFNVGVTTVQYTVYDVNGRSADCSFNVWIKNLNAPQFSSTAPANVSVSADSDVCEAVVSVPAPGINNPCNETYTVFNDSPYKTSDTDASGTYPVGITSVNWIVTDASGVETPYVQNITITDDQFPTVSCPSGFSIPADYLETFASNVNVPLPTGMDDNCDYVLTWTIAEATTDASTNTTGDSFVPSPYPQLNVGDNIITYTITDASNNATPCSFTITVTSAPIIECPTAIIHDTDPGVCTYTVDPGVPTLLQGSEPIDWTWTITDPLGTVVANGSSTTPDDGATPTPIGDFNFETGVSTISWHAENISGFDDCTQTITIEDNEVPTFTSSDIEECVDNLSLAQYVSASLNKSPDPDHFTLPSGNTSLDLTDIADNCCAEADMTINWRIDFSDTPDPDNQPGGVIINPSISGTGQPSTYGSDIILWGDGVTFTTIYHTITYWIEDCNGNTTATQEQTITIKPRPQIN